MLTQSQEEMKTAFQDVLETAKEEYLAEKLQEELKSKLDDIESPNIDLSDIEDLDGLNSSIENLEDILKSMKAASKELEDEQDDDEFYPLFVQAILDDREFKECILDNLEEYNKAKADLATSLQRISSLVQQLDGNSINIENTRLKLEKKQLQEYVIERDQKIAALLLKIDTLETINSLKNQIEIKV